jgi:DNA polymerase III subunit chi
MAGPGLSEVEFHTGVEEPLAFACRLLRKAVRSGARAWVTAPAVTLAELDRSLWTFEERDFLPHVRMPGAPVALAQRTPLWLSTGVDGTSVVTGAPRLLVNLGAQAPTDWAQLDRVIEVVSADADEAQSGRDRWRAYKAAGLNVVHHKASANREA